jgi:hypothetical protein
MAPLLMRGRRGVLGKDGADRGGDDPVLAFADIGQGVAA